LGREDDPTLVPEGNPTLVWEGNPTLVREDNLTLGREYNPTLGGEGCYATILHFEKGNLLEIARSNYLGYSPNLKPNKSIN